MQDKPFDSLVFIEKDSERSRSLDALAKEYPRRKIEVINDDANSALPAFCNTMGESHRAVVFLDPFAANVAWETIEAIAQTKKIDCWILSPRMAISRMMPTGNVPPPQLAIRLDDIFGGREHWHGLYQTSAQLSPICSMMTPRLPT